MLNSIKSFLPHIFVLLGFVVISLIYFNPVLQGKKIFQSDIVQYNGMAKQQNDFFKETGEETYWTNSAFGGMPTYQLGARYDHNYIKELDLALRFLPRPADYLFLYLLSFYILMLVLKLDFKLAALGAVAFGFSTYLIIILGVGHNAKAHAIAYMPLVLSGILLTFQKKYFWGFLLTGIALGLELVANHFQMTYYLLLLVLILGIVYMVDAIKKKMLPHFFKSVGILMVSVFIALGLNATNILATKEYAAQSTRSASELTIDSDGSPRVASDGLDKEYITEYSYGLWETFNLFIPAFKGGGSFDGFDKESNTYQAYMRLGASPLQALEEVKRAPSYWGDQPIVEAPAYIGAVVIFLFVLALFLVKGRFKYWIVGGIILSLFLSYGKNLGWLTDFFIDYVPLYNKFRAVSSIQVILELCIPVMAVVGLSRLLNDFETTEKKIKALKLSLLIVGGLALAFLIFAGSFDFSAPRDSLFAQAYGPDFVEALKKDRKALFTGDTIRSLILVILSGFAIWAFLVKKIKDNALVLILGLLILFDLVGVDRRYVNEEDFVKASFVERPYQLSEANKAILRDTTHFRVLDLTSASTKTNYFHNSLSGYHAAKLRRYNELYDFHIQKNNMPVLNMLNTKYIIGNDENGKAVVYDNPDALGNAWFVDEIELVETADEEIRALDSLKTARTAVINNLEFGPVFNDSVRSELIADSTSQVELIAYKPNYLKYRARGSGGLAVFSEIYYPHGWQLYLNGKPGPEIIRANYVLRAVIIPEGEHEIEFKFEPEVVDRGELITLSTSLITLLIFLSGIFIWYKKK